MFEADAANCALYLSFLSYSYLSTASSFLQSLQQGTTHIREVIGARIFM